jgi:uncharacterized membrane-anchored protein
MTPSNRPQPEPVLPGKVGTVRSDRRTSGVLAKLTEGDIVVLDHLDLDSATARALLDHKPLAVLNTSPFISGRFANLGPKLLSDAGVVLLEIDAEQRKKLDDGMPLRLHLATLYHDDAPVLTGRIVTAESIEGQMSRARSGLAMQLETFTHNAAEYLRREEDMLLHGIGTATLRTPVKDRPVVVVAGGTDRSELRGLRRYIREERPILIGVDGGADDLLSLRLNPDIVVVSEQALTGLKDRSTRISESVLKHAGEVVLHAGRNGTGPGLQRLERLGVVAQAFASAGNTADVAMLLAHQAGARLLIPVGSPASLEDFIDRDRGGQASTFLTRLALGSKVVEATAVPQLYAGRVRSWHLVVILVAALIALVFAMDTTPLGHQWLHGSSAAPTSSSTSTARTDST